MQLQAVLAGVSLQHKPMSEGASSVLLLRGSAADNNFTALIVAVGIELPCFCVGSHR
jgi:hypothetical protein